MKKVWKVFNKESYGYYYTKKEALQARSYWQSLGHTKVMIKGRR